MTTNKLLKDVAHYYSGKLVSFGATPRGVDWRDAASQNLRFLQIAKVLPVKKSFSVNDLGCGYGAFIDFLKKKYPSSTYYGYDISSEMITAARNRHPGIQKKFRKINNSNDMKMADYSVCSGLFNVKLHHGEKIWRAFILKTIHDLNRFSRHGFSFNALTSYSDKDHQRADLFYSNPSQMFDYCKKTFSKNVALLHDYDLYEFTILVRKS